MEKSTSSASLVRDGIALRALVAAEVFELLARLLAEQILDGVEDRRGVRLDRDAVLRPQHAEIERRHDGGERGRRRLMAADLQPVGVLAQMVGVVDGPARQPQHLAFEFAEDGEVGGGDRGRLGLYHRQGTIYRIPGSIPRRAGALLSFMLVTVSVAEHNWVPVVSGNWARGAMPGISIHVVDVSRGVVASGMRVELVCGCRSIAPVDCRG